MFKIYSKITLEGLFGKEKSNQMIEKIEEKEKKGECEFMLVEALREEIEEKTRLAKDEGREIGITEGKAIGITEGKSKGRIEEKIRLVKEMLKEKVDIEFISKITGLSKEEIEECKVS